MYINLWEVPPYYKEGYHNVENKNAPSIIPYIINDGNMHACVVVLPGGGYKERACHEGEPVAKMLNEGGFNAFVLNYRVAPYKYPAPLEDATRAIKFIRYHNEEYNVIKDKIAILGFSAGGHLSSTLATRFDYGYTNSQDLIERDSSRPDATVLCYSVISLEKYTHKNSCDKLLGENPSAEQLECLSNEKQVKMDTPPMFLWHTAEDQAVPVENTLLMAMALSEKKIPFEVYINLEGLHGMGLAQGYAASRWTELCVAWLKKTLDIA